MTLPEVLGRIRFWQGLGDPYVNLIREASKPAIFATATSKYLGTTSFGAVMIGLGAFTLLLLLQIVLGWAVATFRVYRAQVHAEWHANPYTTRQMELLEQIARNTGRVAA